MAGDVVMGPCFDGGQHAWFPYEFNGQQGLMCMKCQTWIPS